MAGRICDWCSAEIKESYTRTYGDEVFLYCCDECRKKHAEHGHKVRQMTLYTQGFNGA